jgi:hypothetical protein
MPGRSAVVFRQRPLTAFLLLVGVGLFTIVLLIVLYPHDLVTVLLTGLLMAAILVPIGLFATQQRLIVDGERIWVRILRWRGPIALADVVGVYLVSDRDGSRELVLVQPTAGPRVGPRSTFMTVGSVRGSAYPGQRYVTMSPWMLCPAVLRLLAPPLLRNPAATFNLPAKALLERRR